MKKKVGVLQFPGSNCDRDVAAYVQEKGYESKFLWHLDQFSSKEFEALILPGGFSYGDYLRAGALSARSPAMKSVREFANQGGPVLGICNGFQVLVEAHLLPGALVRNQSLHFIDDWVELEVMSSQSFWGQKIAEGKKIRLPIAHGEGRFYCSESELKKIEDQDQVWLKYVTNPNGSIHDIAGVFSEKKNIAGLMPHPERAFQDWMGSKDGWDFL